MQGNVQSTMRDGASATAGNVDTNSMSLQSWWLLWTDATRKCGHGRGASGRACRGGVGLEGSRVGESDQGVGGSVGMDKSDRVAWDARTPHRPFGAGFALKGRCPSCSGLRWPSYDSAGSSSVAFPTYMDSCNCCSRSDLQPTGWEDFMSAGLSGANAQSQGLIKIFPHILDLNLLLPVMQLTEKLPPRAAKCKGHGSASHTPTSSCKGQLRTLPLTLTSSCNSVSLCRPRLLHKVVDRLCCHDAIHHVLCDLCTVCQHRHQLSA